MSHTLTHALLTELLLFSPHSGGLCIHTLVDSYTHPQHTTHTRETYDTHDRQHKYTRYTRHTHAFFSLHAALLMLSFIGLCSAQCLTRYPPRHLSLHTQHRRCTETARETVLLTQTEIETHSIPMQQRKGSTERSRI